MSDVTIKGITGYHHEVSEDDKPSLDDDLKPRASDSKSRLEKYLQRRQDILKRLGRSGALYKARPKARVDH